MYERILVPTDGSTDAMRGARHAVDLAAEVGAQIHALYVVEGGGNPWRSESMEDQMDDARAYGEEVTGEVAELARDAGVEVVQATSVGEKVARKINEYVAEEDVDIVVMGSGYYGQMGGLLGGTADKVVRSAEVPVLTVRRVVEED